MKYFILVVFFCSCSLIPWQDEVIDLGGNANFALIWVAYNVHYQENDPFNRWQKPSETHRTKKGDCEDFALLAASGLIAAGEKNVRIVCYAVGFLEEHAIVKWRGKYFEPQNSFQTSIPPGSIITYDADFQTALQRCF